MSTTIRLPVGGAEKYLVSIKDRDGALVDLSGWTITVAIGTYTASAEATSDPHYVEIPIEGDATAAATKGAGKAGYVEATHPSGKPRDGTQFTLQVYAHS